MHKTPTRHHRIKLSGMNNVLQAEGSRLELLKYADFCKNQAERWESRESDGWKTLLIVIIEFPAGRGGNCTDEAVEWIAKSRSRDFQLA